jgi:hypothetical protein
VRAEGARHQNIDQLAPCHCELSSIPEKVRTNFETGVFKRIKSPIGWLRGRLPDAELEQERGPTVEGLEVLDRSDGGDGARKSDVGKAMYERGYDGSLGVTDLQARPSVRAELGRCVSDRG